MYRNTHPSIVCSEFHPLMLNMQEFVKWISAKDYDYETKMKNSDEFKTTAEKRIFLVQQLQSLKCWKKKISHDKMQIFKNLKMR